MKVWQCSCEARDEGKDERGAFRTSLAKEYPSQVACAIAATLLNGIRDQLRPEMAREWLVFDRNGWTGSFISRPVKISVRPTYYLTTRVGKQWSG